MRKDIKFRGKRIDNNEWVYGYYFVAPLTDENSGANADEGLFFLSNSDGITRHCIADENGVVYTVDKRTIGQYIGAVDMYKMEIYEGDFLADITGTYGLVIKDSTQWRWDMGNTTEELDKENSWAEIVGNVWDNPECYV